MDALSEQERSAYCLSDARAAYRLAEIAASEVSGHQLNEEVARLLEANKGRPRLRSVTEVA